MPGLVFRGRREPVQEGGAVSIPLSPEGQRRVAIVNSLLGTYVLQNRPNDYFLLAYYDTIHDFWPSARYTSPATQTQSMHALIDALFQESMGRGPNDAAAFSSITAGSVPTPSSNFEKNTIAYFEANYPSELFALTKYVMSYRDILTDMKGTRTMYNRFQSEYGVQGILEIKNRDGDSFASLTDQDQRYLADFIMTYMEGAPSSGSDIYMTFDAKAGILRKVFRDVPQMVNQIFPQNISDSAPTTFTNLKRTVYTWPIPGEIPIRSAVFSSPNGTTMTLQDNGFSSKNPYGFAIKINNQSPPATTYSLPFGATQRQGPTVSYLADAIDSFTSTGSVRGLSKSGGAQILDISPLDPLSRAPANLLNRILLDLKRIGDHEQVFASMTNPDCYLATIDQLCSLLARLYKKNCIYHYDEDMTLYRFPKSSADPNKVLARQIATAAQECISMGQLIAAVPALINTITAAEREFTIGINGVYNQHARTRNTQSIQDVNTQINIVSRFMTKMLRLRMQDMRDMARAVRAALSGVVGPNMDQYNTLLPILPNLANVSRVETGLANAGERAGLEGYSRQLQTLGEAFKLALTPVRGLNLPKNVGDVPEVGVNLFRGSILIPKTSLSLFNFSTGLLTDIYNSRRALLGLGFPARPPRAEAPEKFTAELATYYGYRDAFVRTFFNPTIGQEAERAGDIPSMQWAPGARDARGSLIGNALGTDIDIGVAVAGGGEGNSEEGRTQSGGATPEQYVRFLSDTFTDICGYANVLTNTMLVQLTAGRVSPDDIPRIPYADKYRALLSANVAVKGILGEIQYYWETQLAEFEDENDLHVPSATAQKISSLLALSRRDEGEADFLYYRDTTLNRRDEDARARFENDLQPTGIYGTFNEIHVLILLAVFDNDMNPWLNVGEFKPFAFPEIRPYPTGRPRHISDYTSVDRFGRILYTNIDNCMTLVLNGPDAMVRVKEMWGAGRRKTHRRRLPKLV